MGEKTFTFGEALEIMKTQSPVDEELVPWLASQTDLLADDWYEVA